MNYQLESHKGTKNRNPRPAAKVGHLYLVWQLRNGAVGPLVFINAGIGNPPPVLLLSAHGMMWSSHTLITKKLYRLPHSILEPFSKELSVGIGSESSRRYFLQSSS